MHLKSILTFVAVIGVSMTAWGQATAPATSSASPSASTEPQVKVFVGKGGTMTIDPSDKGDIGADVPEKQPVSPLARKIQPPSEKKQTMVVAGADAPEDPYVVEIKRLEGVQQTPIPIRSQPLHVAIKLLANAAGMNYIAPPEDEFKETVTMRAAGNPWTVLKELQKKFRFESEYSPASGIWTFFRQREDLLIVRTYQLRYNDISSVKISPPSINTGLGSTSQYSGTNGTSVAGVGSMQSTGGGSSGSGSVFESKTDVIIKGIQEMLKIPVTGLKATVAKEGTIGSLEALPPPGYSMRLQNQAVGSFVQYIPSANRLVIAAAPQSHTYIEEYLRAVDRPQRQMSIRVLFVEVNKDKSADFGLDPTVDGSLKFSLNGSNSFELNNAHWTVPTGTIANTASLTLALKASMERGDARLANKATVVAINNEETQFSSGLKIPIQGTSISTPSTSGTQTQNSVQYIDIGIDTRVLARVFDDSVPGKEQIRMNLALTVSAQAGTQTINDQPYPIVSERKYGLPAIVRNGQTLVIGGLVESQLQTNDKKVPILGDIPLLGWCFKSRSKTDTQHTLIAYITPVLDPEPTDEPTWSDISKEPAKPKPAIEPGVPPFKAPYGTTAQH